MNIFLEKFINKTFEKPGVSMDFGCGKGYDVVCLRHLGWKAFGVDKKEVDLNRYYKKKIKFDLIYSNYVLQFINKKEIFIKSCFDNLKNDGWLFIHTFSKNDLIFKNRGLSKDKIIKLLEEYFKNIKIKKISIFDNDLNHRHWHRVLEITAQK